MADKKCRELPGFRDMLPEDCAMRNYLFDRWRNVASRYAFSEYEAPILESTELYLKKTGAELPTQLFRFTDQGDRDVTLRPEVTASLARIISANQRQFPKPIKWFQIGSCFRYEKPQKGRTREFIQFNADIIGEAGSAADAELIALAIDTMLTLGFTAEDFKIRASDRQSWLDYCSAKNIQDTGTFLQIIDKIERDTPEKLTEKLAPFGLRLDEVRAFIADPENASQSFTEIKENLEARGLGEYLELDLTIVRGLAYYTGVVFEIFDTSKNMRAIAGGGRYDTLIDTMSDGSVDLPCTGFAMGDVVIKNLILETPHAKAQMQQWLATNASTDLYLVITDEALRPHALRTLASLRAAGHKVDFPLGKAKFDKQFKKASALGASHAVIIGSEFPTLKLKNLAERTEESFDNIEQLLSALS